LIIDPRRFHYPLSLYKLSPEPKLQRRQLRLRMVTLSTLKHISDLISHMCCPIKARFRTTCRNVGFIASCNVGFNLWVTALAGWRMVTVARCRSFLSRMTCMFGSAELELETFDRRRCLIDLMNGMSRKGRWTSSRFVGRRDKWARGLLFWFPIINRIHRRRRRQNAEYGSRRRSCRLDAALYVSRVIFGWRGCCLLYTPCLSPMVSL